MLSATTISHPPTGPSPSSPTRVRRRWPLRRGARLKRDGPTVHEPVALHDLRHDLVGNGDVGRQHHHGQAVALALVVAGQPARSEEHTSNSSHLGISYAVF